MNDLQGDLEELHSLALIVAQAFSGYWSVDFLWTADGWYVTDMAQGEHSWHWPGCLAETKEERQ